MLCSHLHTFFETQVEKEKVWYKSGLEFALQDSSTGPCTADSEQDDVDLASSIDTSASSPVSSPLPPPISASLGECSSGRLMFFSLPNDLRDNVF